MTRKLLSFALAFVMLFSFSVPVFAAGMKTPFQDSLFYEQGDYDIHYRLIPAKGEKKGNILFLHGFLYSGESFADMAKLMSEAGYTCVLADLPGFGYSTRETEKMELLDREDLMVGLMKSIAPLDSWVIAGQSMGGGVALNIAVANPEIQALLLYAPAPISQSSMSPFMNKVAGFSMNLILKVMLRMNLMIRLMMYMATNDCNYTKEYDLSVLTAPLAIDGTVDSMLVMMSHVRPTDYETLAKLEMPILLVRGDKDRVVSSSMSAEMDKALSKAEKHTVAGGGHMINETHSKEMSEMALQFLNSIAE